MEISLSDKKDWLPTCERCKNVPSAYELRDLLDESTATPYCVPCIIRHLSVDSENIPSVLDSLEARGNFTKPAQKVDKDTDIRIRSFKDNKLGIQEISGIMGLSKKTIYKSLKRTEPVIKD